MQLFDVKELYCKLWEIW